MGKSKKEKATEARRRQEQRAQAKKAQRTPSQTLAKKGGKR